ncbi:hypothetical protein [Oribacterium sp. Sow4_G1_1]|uniref:hypothetical protein n=1 Tax=Oribacterium sp. Sow4_G1_1 TaxID=3438794 RepID=UPI003F98440F
MSKKMYRLEVLFSDGSVELEEESFETEEDAYEEYLDWKESYPVGQEMMRQLDDEDYSSATITGYRIYQE